MMSDSQLAGAVSSVADAKVRAEVVSPRKSFIVQAPAGSGKTTLLVDRYLNLLSVVKQPEEILAITFTDKAAKEMKRRVLSQLLNPVSPAAERALTRSEKLGWNIELNSQRLKIQTIDSFAYGLVQRMPYESHLNLDYINLATNTDEIYIDAATEFFNLMFDQDDESFAKTVVPVLGLFDDDFNRGVRVLAEMLQRRHDWIKPIQAILTARQDGMATDKLFELLETTRTKYVERLLDSVRGCFDDKLLARCIEICRHAALQRNVSYDDFNEISDWKFFAELFLTQKGEFRKKITKREGFPASPIYGYKKVGGKRVPILYEDLLDENKAKWELTRSELQENDYLEPLQTMHRLVSGEISENLRHLFESLCNGLPLLINCLNEVFQQRECIDYPELNFAAQRALTSHDGPTELALALDYRISHILIDEYQDTSESQFEFFSSIMASWTPDSGNTFFAVGDPMQSIYRFRHANLQLFQRTYNEGLENVQVHAKQLSSNFRSVQPLVEAVNDIFEPVLGSTENANYGAVAFAESTPANQSIEVPDDTKVMELILIQLDQGGMKEAIEAANRITALRARFGPEDSIALLVRNRTRLSTYFKAFQEHEITWKGVDIVKLGEAPVVRDLCSLVEAFSDSRAKLAWLSVFRSNLCGLELPDLEKLSTYETGDEMLRCTSLSATGQKLLARVHGEFRRARKETQLTLRSQIERLWYRLGGSLAYVEVDSLLNAERFFELLEASASGNVRLDELWTRLDSEYVSESGKDADVEIMTIHKAKGLEFDHVLLVDTNHRTRSDQGKLVHWLDYEKSLLIALKNEENEDPFYAFLSEEEKIRDANEQKRLLYVAITRAKKTVSIYGGFKDNQMKPDSGGLLRFLEPFYDDATIIKNAEQAETQQESKSMLLHRLDPEFVWVDPKPQDAIDESYRLPIDTETSVENPINFQQELVVGSLVHRELHRISQCDLNSDLFDSARMTSWRNYLQSEGMEDENIPRLLERTTRHLQNVLGDERGRHILNRDQLEAQSEAAYSAYTEGEFRNIVIDRTFIDEHGVRWIIDYKTTSFAPTKDEEDIVRYSRQTHFAQLKRYAAILQAIDNRPVQCALYYTDIPLMVELNE